MVVAIVVLRVWFAAAKRIRDERRAWSFGDAISDKALQSVAPHFVLRGSRDW